MFIHRLSAVEQTLFLNQTQIRMELLFEAERFHEAFVELDNSLALVEAIADRRHLFSTLELLLSCAQDRDLPMELRKKSVSLMGKIASDGRFYPPTADAALPTPALLMLRLLNTDDASEQVEIPIQLEMVNVLRAVALRSQVPLRLRMARRLSELAQDRRRPRPLRNLAETCALEMSTLH